jgi:hypothetical protein
VSFEALEPLLHDPQLHVVRNAVRLLVKTGTWTDLLGAMELTTSEDGRRADLGTKGVLRWARRPSLPLEPPPTYVRERLAAAARTTPVLPRILVEAFERYGLPLPSARDLLFGTSLDLDDVRDRVARLPVGRFERRYSLSHGRWYYVAAVPGEPFVESVRLQRNLDRESVAEPDFRDCPVLIYVMSTRRPEDWARWMGDDARLLRQRDVPITARA